MLVGCRGCNKPITAKFLVNVLDKSWHSECVICCQCGISLTDKCFSRKDQLYCSNDFYRLFGTKCAGCMQGIHPKHLVRKTRNLTFHLQCFTCCCCSRPLDTGEELCVIDDHQFLCMDDYKNGNFTPCKQFTYISEDEMDSMEPGDTITSPLSDTQSYLQDSTSTPPAPATPNSPLPLTTDIEKVSELSIKEEDNSDDDMDGDKLDDDKKLNDDDKGNKRRGPRTTIKAKQLEILKTSFNKTPKPTRHIREQLAKDTGLPMRVIQVWFQNKRSKERRMKQLSSMGVRSIYQNPRKLRDISYALDENGFPVFPYNTFQSQPFQPFFGPPPIAFPHMGPGMEQPLPPGGPMGGDFNPMPPMNGLMGETFGQHPAMPSSAEDMTSSGGQTFNDHTNSEVMAW